MQNLFTSERFGAEQTLLFSSVLDSVNEGVLLLEPDGKVIASNRTAKTVFGLPEEFTEVNISALFLNPRSPQGRVLTAEDLPYNKTLVTGEPLNGVGIVVGLVSGLDVYLRVNASPLRDSSKNIMGVVLSFTDVTGEFANEVKVKKLIHALQNIPIAVIIFHSDLTIEYVNRFYLKHTGFRESELIGKNISVLPGDTGGNRIEQYISGLGGENVRQIEREVAYYNRLTCWEMVTMSAITDAANEVAYYVAVIEDITERRLQFVELLQTKKAAEESAKLKTSLLTNMSHELRTPINGILGNTQLLQFEEVTEDQKVFISSIHLSAKRLLNTLTAILELAEFEAAKIETRQEPVHPILLMQEIVKELEKEAAEKNLSIQLPEVATLPYLQTDKQLLRRALMHLLENAVKFTDSGTVTVTISLKNDEDYPYCAIKISDTGIGIPAEYMDMIFEPFRQASEGFRRNYEGNGLGLTLAQKCIQALGGIIRVKSEVNKGSSFTVILPL